MHESEQKFSFKQLFIPLTTLKAIHIIIAVSIIVFFFGLFNSFVADDIPQLVENPKAQSISNLISFFKGGTYYSSQNEELLGLFYRPIMLTVFSLISTVFGLNSFFFHFFQTFFHILNSILVFYLFKYFFNKKLSLFLGLIFLVHPINSESVFYISNFQESLFFSLGISSLLLLIYKKEGRAISIIAPLLLFLSLLSKETGILFFFMIVAFIFLFRKDKILKILPFLLSIVVYLLMRIPAVGLHLDRPKSSPIMFADLPERIINIPSLIYFYIVRFFYPKDLVMSYNEVVKTISFTSFYFPLIVISTFFVLWIILGLFVWIKKTSGKFTYLFFSVWFIIGLGLHLQIIPLEISASERWFYFPIVGLLGLVGLIISLLNLKSSRIRQLIPLIAILIIVVLSFRTIVRGFDWKNGLTLYRHDLQLSKNDYFMHGNLGYELAKAGDLEGARQELKKSINLYPHYIIFYSNYCTVQTLIGQKNNNTKSLSEGIACFEEMTKGFDSEGIYKRLIPLLFQNNGLEKAEKYTNEAIKRYPENASFRLYLDEIKKKKENQNSQ